MKKSSEFEEIIHHFSVLKKSEFKEKYYNQVNINELCIDSEYFYLDFSRNLLNSATLHLLEKYLLSRGFKTFREQLYKGGILNSTEKKSVDHIALRNHQNDLFQGDSRVKECVSKSLNKIREITNIIHQRETSRFISGNIKYIVHIGAGGSDIGPRLVIDSLADYKSGLAPEVHFISTVDPYKINQLIQKIDLGSTLFIAVSKSFQTPEVLLLSEYFKNELMKISLDFKTRFLAISANPKSCEILQIPTENLIEFPDSIGGRFSLWSAVGLIISLYLGFDGFLELLKGASKMDRHFLQQETQKNIPVILALLEFWYTGFFQSAFYSNNPYSDRLNLLPLYLQQLQMESNGKSTSITGSPISYPTGTAVIGLTGTSCQHTYFQALHQGNQFFHTDLIGILNPPEFNNHENFYRFLYSSMLAQAKTLIDGNENPDDEIHPDYKKIKGNKPCNLLLLKNWNPATLGNLLAMYEHKTAVLGILWDINSFDQWGVEHGKKVSIEIENCIKNSSPMDLMDVATRNNITLYNNLK